jgi:hypothetical protein
MQCVVLVMPLVVRCTSVAESVCDASLLPFSPANESDCTFDLHMYIAPSSYSLWYFLRFSPRCAASGEIWYHDYGTYQTFCMNIWMHQHTHVCTYIETSGCKLIVITTLLSYLTRIANSQLLLHVIGFIRNSVIIATKLDTNRLMQCVKRRARTLVGVGYGYTQTWFAHRPSPRQ